MLLAAVTIYAVIVGGFFTDTPTPTDTPLPPSSTPTPTGFVLPTNAATPTGSGGFVFGTATQVSFACPLGGSLPTGYGTLTPDAVWMGVCGQCLPSVTPIASPSGIPSATSPATATNTPGGPTPTKTVTPTKTITVTPTPNTADQIRFNQWGTPFMYFRNPALRTGQTFSSSNASNTGSVVDGWVDSTASTLSGGSGVTAWDADGLTVTNLASHSVIVYYYGLWLWAPTNNWANTASSLLSIASGGLFACNGCGTFSRTGSIVLGPGATSLGFSDTLTPIGNCDFCPVSARLYVEFSVSPISGPEPGYNNAFGYCGAIHQDTGNPLDYGGTLPTIITIGVPTGCFTPAQALFVVPAAVIGFLQLSHLDGIPPFNWWINYVTELYNHVPDATICILPVYPATLNFFGIMVDMGVFADLFVAVFIINHLFSK